VKQEARPFDWTTARRLAPVPARERLARGQRLSHATFGMGEVVDVGSAMPVREPLAGRGTIEERR
jgi:hypothetical protein